MKPLHDLRRCHTEYKVCQVPINEWLNKVVKNMLTVFQYHKTDLQLDFQPKAAQILAVTQLCWHVIGTSAFWEDVPNIIILY